MKKKISLLLAILMLVTLLPTAFAESKTVEARKTSQKLTLDGKEVNVGFYNIAGSNYIKLRDTAAIFKDTEKKFSVAYDSENKSFIIEIGKDYTLAKGDLDEIKQEKANASMSIKTVLINYDPKGTGVYEEKRAQTAFINGNNYLKLRDLADLAGFYIDFDEKTKTIELKTEYQSDPTYEGFVSTTFTEEDEKIFNNIIGLYDALANNDKDAQYKYTRDLTFNTLSDDECESYIARMKELGSLVNIKSYNKDYKAEKRVENYADGKGYMVFFNSAESTITLDFFIPEKGDDYQMGLNSYSGDNTEKGYADSYYDYKDMSLILNTSPLWDIHDNMANKEYDKAYENFKSLGLDGDKEKMMKFFEAQTKDFDVLHPKYTYKRFKSRFFSNTIITYIFNYGTKDELIMNYNYSPTYVSLNVQCREKTNNNK